MKKVIMLAAVVAALASCQSKANKAAEAEADSLSIEMAPITEVTEVYEGTLPAADGPGIDYVLTLNTKAVKLTPNDGEAPMYFVIVNDTTLRLVNDSLQEAVSDLNYDIIKVKK